MISTDSSLQVFLHHCEFLPSPLRLVEKPLAFSSYAIKSIIFYSYSCMNYATCLLNKGDNTKKLYSFNFRFHITMDILVIDCIFADTDSVQNLCPSNYPYFRRISGTYREIMP